MIPEIEYGTLSSGVRVVIDRHPGIVEHCGVAVNAGSRDESPDRHGLTHFVEHTIFKGTHRRKAWHILNRMETVGGELNAYTTKEETMLYSTFPSGNLTRAVDLIADIIINSRFPATEIDREREVVADEIDSYLDIPSEGIFDEYEDMIFDGSPLGHNILGTRESIDTFTSDICREYLDRFYSPGEMVFFYSGPESAAKVFRVAERAFSTLSRNDVPRQRVTPAVLPPFDSRRDISSHQAHTLMGARVPGLSSPARYALALLTNILGGPGMNSRLNVALRERRGLVYTIDAGTTLLSDCGLFNIYFGCDHDDVTRCRRLVCNILTDIADKGLTERNLAAAKKQYIGQLAVASTNTEQQALSIARSTLYRGSALTRDKITDNIRSVTRDDILSIASHLTPDKISTLTLG